MDTTIGTPAFSYQPPGIQRWSSWAVRGSFAGEDEAAKSQLKALRILLCLSGGSEDAVRRCVVNGPASSDSGWYRGLK